MNDVEFKVGDTVAYVETWPVFRVITAMRVRSVGKRDIKVFGSNKRFRVDGSTWDTGVYRNRAIQPMTDAHREALAILRAEVRP